MAHDDTVIVIVLHPVEEILAVGEVLLRGIEDAVAGIGSLIGGGNLRDIGLHADDDGLVRQTEALHLMGGDAHRHRLAGADLMVAHAAAVLQQHPHAVLLRLVDVVNLVLADGKTLHVKTWEGLVTTVIAGLDEAVVLPVVHIGQGLLPLVGVTVNPLRETVTDLVNLAGRKLYLLMVRPHNGVTIGLVTDTLLYHGNGIVQGMAQQVLTVVGLRLTRHGKLLAELGTVPRHIDHELVKLRGIVNPDVRAEKLGGELGEIGLGHPALTEIEVQLSVGNGPWHDSLQGGDGTLQLLPVFRLHVILQRPSSQLVELLHDIARKELVTDLIAIRQRIVVNTLLQLVTQLLLGEVTDGGHVLQVNAAVTVE